MPYLEDYIVALVQYVEIKQILITMTRFVNLVEVQNKLAFVYKVLRC